MNHLVRLSAWRSLAVNMTPVASNDNTRGIARDDMGTGFDLWTYFSTKNINKLNTPSKVTILNSGRTHLSPFENGLREIVSDELQCAESTLVYIDFMVNVMNEFSGGPDDVDTVRRVMDSIAKFDPSKSGIISIHGKWSARSLIWQT